MKQACHFSLHLNFEHDIYLLKVTVRLFTVDYLNKENS